MHMFPESLRHMLANTNQKDQDFVAGFMAQEVFWVCALWDSQTIYNQCQTCAIALVAMEI